MEAGSRLYFTLGIENGNPAVNSAAFNTILGDLYAETIWVNDIAFDDLVDASNYDLYFQNFNFSSLEYFWANDPNGSNGLGAEE